MKKLNLSLAVVISSLMSPLSSAQVKTASAPPLTSPGLTSLIGSEWGPENGFDQFVQFKQDGELYGFAGCNSFIGNYLQTQNRLRITSLTTTQKKCAGVMGAEAAFIDGMKNAHTLKIDGIIMKIFDPDNIWVLGLRRRDID